ncbi:MAG: DUF4011 domain-containing protein, partial [Cytophagaceae bacterium]|nr:DUF4011 domain-containing protein [Cytophagaceae bacterium]
MHSVLKSLLKRLTNLTGSNRSLLLLRTSADQDFDLHELDFINNSYAIIEGLIAGKKSIKLSFLIDSRNASVNEISKRFKKIERREKFIFEERGSKDLYVGWPFIRGKFSDGTPVRCPLLFFPVTLETKENDWVINLREDVSVGFNKSFLLAYAYYNDINLSDDFLETSFENLDTDSQVFRTQLYQLLKESSVELNFNQEIFVNKLIPFENFKKEDFEKKFQNGELKLFSEALLGLFPQAGSYLMPDYDFLIKNNSISNLEEFFLSKTLEENREERKIPNVDFTSLVKEEQTFTPFSLDASQENAVKAVKKGNSVVIQGPPGTGKSQVICNLISDFISRGKNVLLVCQKRVALDVVYDRLKEKGIGEFVGLIHDFKNDRKAIYDQINSQIDKVEEYKYRNSSLDAIYLERNFVQLSRRIDQLTEELNEFKTALFDESECGISVKELYLTSNPADPSIEVKQEFKYFSKEEIQKFVRFLRIFLPYATKFEKMDYMWNDRVSFKDFSVSDKKKILELLDHIPFYQSDLSDNIRELLGPSLDFEDMEWLLDREIQIRQLLNLLEEPRTYSNFIFFLNRNTDQDWLIIKERQITECFKGYGIETTLASEQLGAIQKALENARNARRGLFKWLWWKWFSKDKYLVKRLFAGNKMKWNRESFEKATEMVDNRMNLEHNLTEMKTCGWLQNVPEEKDLNIISEWMHYQQTALGTKALLKELRSLKDYLNIPSLTYDELKDKLNRLIKIVNQAPAEKKRWMQYLSPRQISKILSGFDYAIELAAILKTDFESLVEYDKMQDKLRAHEKPVLEKLLKCKSDGNVDTLINIFQNSVKLEWVDFIEMKYPVLRAVSSLKMEQMESELQECMDEKQKLSQEILLLKVRDRTYRNLEFNRLDNMVTYRELKHQVTKKKKVWPMRKLVSGHASEIFQLVPCWLASPESVSAVFPIETMFDLVIFDEASQCYTERGIPAVFRGKQVVITGDNKQLPPSDLYQVRWDENESDLPELEAESLLDLGDKFLTKVKLSGHYRSRSLDLIEFSNQHFYNNDLKVLPDFSVINDREPAIKYIKVNGLWENNMNLREAQEVIAIVKKIIAEEPEKSIGIVTFNFKQQNLIQDLLEDQITVPPSLIVKNIENIQGDERDIVIFSIAYAPDATGKMSMLFGSLNAEGGENRLNVAVTRAREKVIVVSSISHHQLNVNDLKHKGPKLLKKYLQYAEEVSNHKFKAVPREFPGYKTEWFLKKQLAGLSGQDFFMKEELPLADLTVKEKNNY